MNTSPETICREYAGKFPTPNVLRGVALAESGRITWTALAGLFARSLEAGLAAVSA